VGVIFGMVQSKPLCGNKCGAVGCGVRSRRETKSVIPGFNPLAPINFIVFILLSLAWKFWHWTWETVE
jgi:hypothetical protein